MRSTERAGVRQGTGVAQVTTTPEVLYLGAQLLAMTPWKQVVDKGPVPQVWFTQAAVVRNDESVEITQTLPAAQVTAPASLLGTSHG